jgi:hypothetical protein
MRAGDEVVDFAVAVGANVLIVVGRPVAVKATV